MTVVLDTTPVRFTPAKLIDTPGAPVYLIQPGTSRTRAIFRRELVAQGVQYQALAVVYETLRDGVRTGIKADDRDFWLALIDRSEDVAGQLRELAFRPEPLVTELPGLDPEERADMASLERDMRLNYRPYAALLADQQFYLEMAPMVAAQHFLVGWENVEHEFVRDNKRGVVELALLDRAIGEAHIKAIGNRALGLLTPDRAAAKNSPSRPGSPASRETSTAGSRPSTGRGGKSRAKSTRKTRAT